MDLHLPERSIWRVGVHCTTKITNYDLLFQTDHEMDNRHPLRTNNIESFFSFFPSAFCGSVFLPFFLLPFLLCLSFLLISLLLSLSLSLSLLHALRRSPTSFSHFLCSDWPFKEWTKTIGPLWVHTNGISHWGQERPALAGLNSKCSHPASGTWAHVYSVCIQRGGQWGWPVQDSHRQIEHRWDDLCNGNDITLTDVMKDDCTANEALW